MDAHDEGWARVLVHESLLGAITDQGGKREDLVFEGSFAAAGQLWHIKTFDVYQRLRTGLDPPLSRQESHPTGGLVVWLVATWAHIPLSGWAAGIWRWL